MIARHLKYLIHAFKHPRRTDFIDMGLGIEARYARCHEYWQSHIVAAQKFQDQTLADLFASHSLKKIAVLGSGRLYDLSPKIMNDSQAQLHLFDADPSAAPKPSRIAGQVHWHCGDLTGVIDGWSIQLKNSTKSSQQALQQLNELQLPLPPELGKFDVLISLNLLSQLALFWQDRVHQILEQKLRIKTDNDGQLPKEWEEALRRSMRLLQQQHLNLLKLHGSAPQTKMIILIADRTWHYYQSTNKPPTDLQPGDHRDRIKWRAVNALAVDPLEELRSSLGEPQQQAQWQWHIAPQFIEQRDHGSIHSVEAFSWQVARDK